MNETSPLSLQHLCSVFSFFVFFCFVSILIPSLIWQWRRGAIENLVERVFMVDSVARWVSQRRMLIRQPRLRLIWLAAVTPPSCRQSVLRLFLPLQCITASSLQLFPSPVLDPFRHFTKGAASSCGLVPLVHKVTVIHSQPWRSITVSSTDEWRLLQLLRFLSPSWLWMSTSIRK